MSSIALLTDEQCLEIATRAAQMALAARATEPAVPASKACKLIGCSEPQLSAWARRRGGVPHEHKGNDYRVFFPDVVIAWAKAGGMTRMVLNNATNADWLCPVCGVED